MQYRFDGYALDTRRCELRRTGTLIKLRPKVFDVLRYLIAHRDRVISRQELLEHLWPQQFVGEATLNSSFGQKIQTYYFRSAYWSFLSESVWKQNLYKTKP